MFIVRFWRIFRGALFSCIKNREIYTRYKYYHSSSLFTAHHINANRICLFSRFDEN